MKTRFLWLVLGSLVVNGFASDRAREQRIADELSDAVIEGESIFIEIGETRFWSIYTEADARPKGAVVILHGRGLHPDWPAVARPLRISLPKRGWSTLAFQLPVLAKGSDFYDYAEILPEAGPRIEAAIRYLRRRGYPRVHLVAHSCGAQMTMAWIETGGGQDLSSLTVVSMGMTKYARRFGHLPPLDKLPIPIMDIYGGQDFVAKRAPQRLQLIRAAGNSLSQQLEVPNAKHMFKEHGAVLTDAVAGWLDSLQ